MYKGKKDFKKKPEVCVWTGGTPILRKDRPLKGGKKACHTREGDHVQDKPGKTSMMERKRKQEKRANPKEGRG